MSPPSPGSSPGTSPASASTGPTGRSASRTRRGWQRALMWLAALVLCLAVFAMYTVPDFMVMVADKVWSCF